MLSALKSLFRKKPVVGVSVYQGAEFSLEEISLFLSQYEGGSVDLELDEQSGIATVCLSHAEKKNCLTGKMLVDMERVVSKLECWEAGKGLLIYGAEHNFCSGGDLGFAQQTGTAEGGYKMATFMQNVLLRLQHLPLVSAAFIEGYALGGGAELAIACDFRLFSNNNSSYMGFVHTKMGIIPAWGGLTSAVQKLGYRVALELVVTGRVVGATEARQLGLCDVEVGNVADALSWLQQRTSCDASCLRAAKCVASYIKHMGNGVDALDFEKRVFSPLWGGPANRLALTKKLKHLSK